MLISTWQYNNNYLSTDIYQVNKILSGINLLYCVKQNDVGIVADSLTVSWSNDDNPLLENISFTVDKVRNYCPYISFANDIH